MHNDAITAAVTEVLDKFDGPRTRIAVDKLSQLPVVVNVSTEGNHSVLYARPALRALSFSEPGTESLRDIAKGTDFTGRRFSLWLNLDVLVNGKDYGRIWLWVTSWGHDDPHRQAPGMKVEWSYGFTDAGTDKAKSTLYRLGQDCWHAVFDGEAGQKLQHDLWGEHLDGLWNDATNAAATAKALADALHGIRAEHGRA